MTIYLFARYHFGNGDTQNISCNGISCKDRCMATLYLLRCVDDDYHLSVLSRGPGCDHTQALLFSVLLQQKVEKEMLNGVGGGGGLSVVLVS